MSAVLKTVLSLSFSGSLIILLLLLGKPLLKNRLSKRWQYYIWLVVVARLLLPFTPEVSIAGTLFRQLEQTAIQAGIDSSPIEHAAFADEPEMNDTSDANFPAPAVTSVRDLAAVSQYLWVVWLGGAMLLLIRKVTVYQGFVKYIQAGCEEVSEITVLDRFAQIEEQMGVKRPVELCTNHLISSPLLLGFFHPCIVLPASDLPETDFEYTVRHELTHSKQGDMFYKWLVQVTICLHWFNPLVWWLGKEISRACELACDEAVIRTFELEERRAYGDTLLRAMEAGGSYQNSLASVTLNESAELLKERLSSIMRFRKSSKLAVFMSFILAGVLITGAAATGAYSGTTKAGMASTRSNVNTTQSSSGRSAAAQAERFYKAESLPGFQMVFSQLSEKEQRTWLERMYADGRTAFFSVSINQLDAGSPLIADLAETLYVDGSISFFSILAGHMSKGALEDWLDRALADENFSFQSMLFGKLDMEDKLDAMEEELAKKQLEEYQAVDVTKQGKNYYYQGQLVNIFLDHRPDTSFYTLDMNPMGTVNVKILRDKDGKVKGTAYLTEEEREELFGGALEDIDIPVAIDRVKSGEYVWLGTYTLDADDQVYYEFSAESGKQLDVGFAKPGEKTPGTKYHQVSCQSIDGELELTSGPMMWEIPLEPGNYSLFVHAEGGALTNVEGCVTIVKAEP